MKLFILLFFFIVVTCQAYQSPLRMQQIARQGDPGPDEPTLDEQVYEKLKKLAKKYMAELDPNVQALLVPAIYKVDHLRTNYHVYNPTMSQQYSNPNPSRFNNPALQQRNSFNNPSRMDQAEADRLARLAQVDKEALSKLSKEDKRLIENSLTQSEREALLAELEDGKLDDFLQNRFGGAGSSVISGVAAQIGSSAGSYIGRKLAGTLGAKLGAAAGAYLGAAAASRFVKKFQVSDIESDNVSDIVSDDVEYNTTPQGKAYQKTIGGTATYGFGAYNVK